MGGPGSGSKPREYPPEIVSLVCGLYQEGLTVAEIRRVAPKGYRIQTILERYLPSRRPAIKRNQYGVENDSWRGDACGYQAAHLRVASLYGKASSHQCTDCHGQAAEWSYRHDDPDECVDGTGRSYSPDPSHYEPRCVSCHRRFDAARRRQEVMPNV
jgi:hypothetical protein